ncbi:MAG: endo alpha-1,4 polygalactosaminidase [Solirubrobacterales bacterium]
MGRVLVPTVLAVAGLCVGAPGAGSAPRHPKLQQVRSFAFALGTGTLDGDVTARFAAFDLVVVDGEEARSSQVRALRARGKLVLAYLSVGTVEPGRFWYRQAKAYRLRDRFEEFDEYYAATSKRGYRRLIERKVAPRILAKGFDGLFLDNTDMIADHPRQRQGMYRLVRALARLVHRRGKLLFSQNGDDVIGPSLRYYDGWNREDVTWTYDFDRRRYERVTDSDTRAAQATMRRLARRGLLVTSSDYTRAGDKAAEAEAVHNSCTAGGLPFVTNIGITRIPTRPFVCR